MKKNLKNNILLQAWLDYDPSIVMVNEDFINNNPIKDLSAVPSFVNLIIDLDKSLMQILINSSINYMFWDKNNNNFVRYQNNGLIGALAMSKGVDNLFNDFINNKITKIDKELINYYFGDIPDLNGRVEILNEILNKEKINNALIYIKDRFKYFKEADTNMAKYLIEIFPISFNDEYAKKIQLAIYEMAIVYEKYNNVNIKKNKLTVAADYQLPKVLEAMGYINYSENLKDKINNYDLIKENSKEEKAIRAATIISCDLICEKNKINVEQLDRFLWEKRNDFKDKKFHLTKTRKY